MELTQLKYFLSVANSLHFSKTAEILHVSQSTLSMAISRMEQELGVKLFDRGKRSITLTYAGQRFAARLTPAMAEIENACVDIQALSKVSPERIEISIEVMDFAGEFLMHFLRQYPMFRFRQTIDTTEVAIERLLCHKADFCFSYEPFEYPNVTSILLQTDPVLLIVHKDHPLAKRSGVFVEEISNEPLATIGAAYGFRHWTDQMCIRAGFRPNVCYEMCDLQNITRTVENRQAVAFISKSTWEQNGLFITALESEHAPIRAIPILNQHCVRTVYLCWTNDRALPPNAAQFLAYAKNQCT